VPAAFDAVTAAPMGKPGTQTVEPAETRITISEKWEQRKAHETEVARQDHLRLILSFEN
jgi:hypothetical protein